MKCSNPNCKETNHEVGAKFCHVCGAPLIPNSIDEKSGRETSTNALPPVKTFNVNGVSFNMILVEGGTFWMGAQADDPKDRNYDSNAAWYSLPDKVGESPVHEVTLSSFYIGETVITQALWKAGGGKEATMLGGWRYGRGGNLPAYHISWNEFDYFIHKLNQYTGQKFRMPTEAEWEFAARGGNRSGNTIYAGSNSIDDVAWYWKNSGDKYLLGKTDNDIDWRKMEANNCRVHAVKEKLPNELGLYDMSGNVWEWCQDIWGKYEDRPQYDPWGPYSSDSRASRVIRGGSWGNPEKDCRITNRHGLWPFEGWMGGPGCFGLRLCLPC